MNIVFHVGYSKHNWSPRTLENTGLGGTEQCVVFLAQELSKLHNVYVVGDVHNGNYGSVEYINTNHEFYNDIKEMSIDILIGVSYVHFVKEYEGCRVNKYIYWAHNTEPFWFWRGEKLEEPILDRIDGFVFLTNWHKEDFLNRYDLDEGKSTYVIGNGIRMDRVSRVVTNEDYFLYSSHAERGLDKVLNDGFIKKTGKHLKVATPQYGETYLKENFDTSTFEYIGSLPQKDLYDQMAKASYWYYPTDYQETYCITAIEMLAHGVLPIMDNVHSGLEETLNGFYITTEQFLNNDYDYDHTAANKYVKSRDWSKVSKEWNKVIDYSDPKISAYTISLNFIPDLRSKVEEITDVEHACLVPGIDLEKKKPFFDYEVFPWKIDSDNSWYNRPLKKGEVGCMLSHIDVLKQAYDEGLDYVLILEEDFSKKRKLDLSVIPKDYQWDILFLGRNPVSDDIEIINDELVVPGYSYCTHAILYRRSGIERILQGSPEKYIMPWDEYLAATYTTHPRKDLSFIWSDISALAFKEDVVTQTSSVETSSTENTDYYNVEKNYLLDTSDWEAWKQRWLSYEALTKEWDLIVDEPIMNVFTFPLFNEDFCKKVIEYANDKDEWETDRHDYYPTIDVLLEKIGLDEAYARVLKEYADECAIHMWGLEGKNWRNLKSENFMIKYTEEKQGHLSLHHDYSDLSYVVALNEDYKGGGTYFLRQKALHKGKTGHISLHPGAISHKHGGRPVHKGERYIIVSFCRFPR